MNLPLNNLLAQLCSGDPAAAEEAFRRYEPYLRKAVRRQIPVALQSRFDSTDILQSVWADVFRGFREAGWQFRDADQLRGFLFVATRNRLIDRVRQHQKEQEREAAHGDPGPTRAPPSPSEVAQAADLWERLLAHCPAEHHALLSLRRQGHSFAEIAARTGLHADSVRRILRTLARELALESQECACR